MEPKTSLTSHTPSRGKGISTTPSTLEITILLMKTATMASGEAVVHVLKHRVSIKMKHESAIKQCKIIRDAKKKSARLA